MKKTTRKKLRYGSIAAAITVLVVCAVVILNVIVSMLASRYEWMYVDMNKSHVYSVSDAMRDYIDEYVIPEIDKANTSGGQRQKITVIFCDTEKNIKADEGLSEIYKSIAELCAAYPDYIETDHLDVWEDPSAAKELGVTSTSDIVCKFGSEYETVNFKDFYITDPEDQNTAVAYNGERMLASCFMRITENEDSVCYFTVNHGERIENVSLLRTVIEAGYSIDFIDLSSREIPEDCHLLVTFAPERDLIVSDGADEYRKLEEYMLSGGRYMFFADADTYASGGHENFESLLASWGVSFMHKTANDGIEQSYVVRDMSNSLTVDGYTVLAERAEGGFAASMLEGSDYPYAFANSTCISFSSDFTSDGNGNFVKREDGIAKTVAPLLVSHPSAEAWMGGMAVARADKQPFTLMSISKSEDAEGKVGYLLACASTEFASGEVLGSAVLGNGRAMIRAMKFMGKDNAPTELVFKKLTGNEIESLTASAANTYAIILATVPTLAIAACGAVVIIRRKYL